MVKKERLKIGDKYVIRMKDHIKFPRSYKALWNGTEFKIDRVAIQLDDVRTASGPIELREIVFLVCGEETRVKAPCVFENGHWVQVGDSVNGES